MTKERLREELSIAKDRIEQTFETKVSTWYLPFGRRGENVYGEEVCRELGIIYDKQTQKINAGIWLHRYKKKGISEFPHANFHYWYQPQVDVVNEILTLWQEAHKGTT